MIDNSPNMILDRSTVHKVRDAEEVYSWIRTWYEGQGNEAKNTQKNEKASLTLTRGECWAKNRSAQQTVEITGREQKEERSTRRGSTTITMITTK